VTGTDANGCTATATVTITVNSVSAGSVGPDQTLCFGGDPAAFTGTAATGSGTITYQWQISTTGPTTGFTDIPGATSATYDPPVIAQDTWYRRVAYSNLGGVICSAATSDIEVLISPANPGSIAASQTICSGGDPAAFTSVPASSPYTVSITYQWQMSTDNGATWTDIALATLPTYDASF